MFFVGVFCLINENIKKRLKKRKYSFVFYNIIKKKSIIDTDGVPKHDRWRKEFVMKLMKLMLAMALVLVVVLALASCGCEHVYDEAITTKPTCTTEGVKTFTCSECGESYTEAVAATGHTYTDTVVEPTCTAEGYTEHTCACGDTYKDATTAKLAHTYAEEVTAPTCTVAGYTTYTCACGDTYKGAETAATGVHVYAPVLVELTAEQAAANPNAIGIEKNVCTGCGAEGEGGAAVLIFMDFETVPNAATYEGSQAYKDTLAVAAASATDEVKTFLAYIDSQKNMTLEATWGATKANVIADGKYLVTNSPVYLPNELGLSSESPAVSTFTLSFDVVINMTGKADKHLTNATAFFSMTDIKKYSNRSFILALDHTDVDSNTADDVYAYELVSGAILGKDLVQTSTGYVITLGKEYSFKMNFDSVAKMVEIYVKEAGAAEYTALGSYEYKPHTASLASCFNFALSSANNKNLFDNFKVTTDLVK